MIIKWIKHESFQDYKKPAMLIGMPKCDWKCLTELGLDQSICQNCKLAELENVVISTDSIIHIYENNPITSAIIFGGLEPMLSINELVDFISEFRKNNVDDIVIYTGYYPHEIQHELTQLSEFENIIIKFGRFVPNKPKVYDDILGIELVSDNQFAKIISTKGCE